MGGVHTPTTKEQEVNIDNEEEEDESIHLMFEQYTVLILCITTVIITVVLCLTELEKKRLDLSQPNAASITK